MNGGIATVYGNNGVYVDKSTSGKSSSGRKLTSGLNSSNMIAVDAKGFVSSAILKRMIDQTPVSSTGTAPKDTANGDPLSFTLSFKKDNISKGYKNATGTYSGPYTIVKALVDVN